MATISTAPSPLDGISAENLNEWLGHPATQALVEAIKANIAELDIMLTNAGQIALTDVQLGATTRSLLVARGYCVQLLEWVKGADYVRT
jgi:hypothetical protein